MRKVTEGRFECGSGFEDEIGFLQFFLSLLTEIS